MKKSILKVLGLSIAVLFVMTMVYSCGSSSSSSGGGTPATATGTVTLSATSGTLGAVNLNSMFSEDISAALGKTAGTVDPTSITISISPALSFTQSGLFSNVVDIVPAAFLTASQTYSVTTSFTAGIGGKNYSFTEYNTFTTVASAGTKAALPGDNYLIPGANIVATQPSTLASILSGNIPSLAISIITATIGSSLPSGADGSMLLYGGEAVNSVAPIDITTTSFTIPLISIYKGNEFMSSGSVVLAVNVGGLAIQIPFQSFSLRGMANADGTISNGVLYGVVHCNDTTCSNIPNTTVSSVVSQNLDANNNMTVLANFSGLKNGFVPSPAWISGSDTTGTTLANGIGGVTTATLEVTTTSSPLLTIPTLPFVILTQTDANGMLSIVGDGQSPIPTLPTTSPISFIYPLLEPGLTATQFTTVSGQTYTAYYMFGLTGVLTTPFKP